MAEGEIEPATLDDLEEITLLYRDTILMVNSKDYTAEQTAAWSGRYTNTLGWTDKINSQHFLLMREDGQLTGFSSLTKTGHVDMLFVHKDHQGKGIAKQLLTEIEKVAIEKGFQNLTTNASKTARPVFEHFGFTVITEETVVVDGIALNNYRMNKALK
ncbi:GNAT family N-acetyltransferase [Mucilaginibacter litoreus]|uniref:GNAT family N-acetyltransferase n=1 Tax=Mucilaginibacter litoreus TaxID=1048221 RepID=A0ABW3AW60_9SPHI